jgi:hypothetical protein
MGVTMLQVIAEGQSECHRPFLFQMSFPSFMDPKKTLVIRYPKKVVLLGLEKQDILW